MKQQMSKRGNILTLIVLVAVVSIALTLITSPIASVAASHDSGNQKSKDKPKAPKCNNVQILLKVSKIPKNSKILTAQATLDGKSVDKTQNVKGDSKVSIPLSFKKLDPCPKVSDSFSGNVNGTSFNGQLTSLVKPNKVNVPLS
jgi:hypothetical protein